MSLMEARGAKRILVVEDDSLTRGVLLLFLGKQGYEMEGAANGQEALAYLEQREHPHLILLDLTMPKMDGWQFLEEKRRNPGLAGIPVIVLSAEDWAVDPGEGCLEADDFLVKPVDPKVLLWVVGRHCGDATEPGGITALTDGPGRIAHLPSPSSRKR
jgi:CheY-like chemotaxis protein